jgi:hypothetical protein
VAACQLDPRVPRAGGSPSVGPGSQSSPSFPQAPNLDDRVQCLGSAKPIACDATAGSDLDAVAGSRTMDRREDGTAQHRFAAVSLTDQWCPASTGPARGGRGPQGQRPTLVPGQRRRRRRS